MAKKRAMVGFKGVALAEIEENSLTSYKTKAAVGIPYAGKMTRTPKETTQDFFYDDGLYAQMKDLTGEEVEVRFAEIPLEKLAELGYGKYDEEKRTLEADFNVVGKSYAFCCVCDTIDHLPYYFKWRVFDLNSIKFDNFSTKGSSLQICEVIVTGVFKRPTMMSAMPYVIKQPKDDGSDLAACDAWLAAAETLPV